MLHKKEMYGKQIIFWSNIKHWLQSWLKGIETLFLLGDKLAQDYESFRISPTKNSPKHNSPYCHTDVKLSNFVYLKKSISYNQSLKCVTSDLAFSVVFYYFPFDWKNKIDNIFFLSDFLYLSRYLFLLLFS